MSAERVGSYAEAREFSLKQFSRLSPTKKLQWLAAMAAFLDRANPTLRNKRFGRRLRKRA